MRRKRYNFKRLPQGMYLASDKVINKYLKEEINGEWEKDNHACGGRQIEEDRPYLEQLLAPVPYHGPPGVIECCECQRELLIDETCVCQAETESSETQERIWEWSPGTIKSSRCEGIYYRGRTYFCYYDREKDFLCGRCRRCRRHLAYIKKLYLATKA